MRSARSVVLGLGLVFGGCSSAPDDSVGMTTGTQETRDAGVAPQMPTPGLSLTVRSSDDLQPMPARVIIKPHADTKKPDFRSDGSTGSDYAPGAIGGPDGVMLVTGQARVPLWPGSYDLTLLQGPEYEMVQRSVVVGKGGPVTVDVVLERAVRTDGWLAADMHIHSKVSFDSKVATAHRVVSEVSSGVELLVPTEHVYHYDLQPTLVALGYAGRALSIPGSEYGFNPGHIGVYPVVYDPQGKLFGAPLWEEWPWSHIDPEVYFPLIHALPGRPLVVINHPRLGPDLGYFDNIGWRPGAPLKSAGLFDAVEVLSGYESAPEDVTLLLRDWFTLLNEGRRVTALGNSDTHRIDWLRAGYPRTWLRLPTEEPRRVLPDDLREALVNMRAIASMGPWVNLTVDGKGIGDTVAAGAQVKVRVEADAPSWIDLTQVQLYQNGALVKTLPIDARVDGRHPVLRQEVTLDISADGWLVAIAVGDRPLPIDVIGAVMNGRAKPIALTNPVWLDRDGDGKITPPGGVGQPKPFGVLVQDLPPRASVFAGPILEAPLDCEPQAYRDWLF